MLKRLHFIFLKRYQDVKPVDPRVEDTQWLNMSCNVFEALEDDALRYGFGVAFSNFIECVQWRNQVYSERQENNHAPS